MSTNEDEFTTLFAATRVAVLGYLLRRCADKETAADLLAETYAVAWQRRDKLPGGDDARLWLFTIARNLLYNERRAQRRRDLATQRLADAIRSAGWSDAAPTSLRDIREALNKLRPVEREILTLTVWEGLTPAEIAIVIGQSSGAVRVRLHRARKRLRSVLTSLDDDPLYTAGGVATSAQ